MPGNRVDDLYIISPATALTSTSMSTKSTSRWRKRKRERALWSAHTTCSQHSTSMSTCHRISKAHSDASHHLRISTVASPSSPHSSYCPTISHRWVYKRRLNVHCMYPGQAHAEDHESQDQAYYNSNIRMCVDHSPRRPEPAIATISYSSTITHATPLIGSSKIRSQKHAPQPTIRIVKRKRE